MSKFETLSVEEVVKRMKPAVILVNSLSDLDCVLHAAEILKRKFDVAEGLYHYGSYWYGYLDRHKEAVFNLGVIKDENGETFFGAIPKTAFDSQAYLTPVTNIHTHLERCGLKACFDSDNEYVGVARNYKPKVSLEAFKKIQELTKLIK